MRKGFRTNLEETLIDNLKIRAIKERVDVNDILEPLIEKYLNNEIEIILSKKQ